LFAGDSMWDMQAVNAIDGIGIGLECGGTSEAELREAGAKHVFRTPEGLLAALQASGS
jgi:phosphoglycolate phosphatase-like HAD superfamily hydrolase